MRILRWLLGGRRRQSASAGDVESEEQEYLTYEEAREIAERDAKRALSFAPEKITYVCHEKGLADYCRIDIAFAEPDRGLMTLQLLPLAEREEDEMLTDDHIREVAQSGRTIAAIRLYRFLHSVGLKEGKEAIDRYRAT